MRFDFSRFLLEVEQRVRRFRGLTLAGRILLYASIASILLVLGLHLYGQKVSLPWSILIPIVPLFLAGGAFAFGFIHRPSLPQVLLRLDDALGSGARISSLYEVRRHGGASIFRERLEAAVEHVASDWKRGVSLPRRTFGTLSVGLVGLVVACIIVLLPISNPRAVSSAQALPASASEAQHRVADEAGSASENMISLPDEADAPLVMHEEDVPTRQGQLPNSVTIDESAELSLDSVLDDLSSASHGGAQVDSAPTSQEVTDMANAQQQARDALSDMLKELQQQMQGNPRPLTQQESRTLQDLASQTGDPEIQQQSDDIVNEPNPEQVGDKLQDLMQQVDPDSASPEDIEQRGENSPQQQGQPQSTEVSGNQEAGQKFLDQNAQQLEQQSNNPDTQEEGEPQPTSPRSDEGSQKPGEDGSSDIQVPGNPEDLAQQGGDQGLAGESGEGPQAGEVGFVHEEAPTTVGTQGEFTDEFMTKGVPVEIVTSTGEAGSHIVDFERIDSILHERGLPDEALDSVRKYFELITGPEGGS